MVRSKFLGMALLYHFTHFLSITLKNLPFPEPSLKDLLLASQELCQVPWARVSTEFDGLDPNTPSNSLRGRCFDGALVVTLLGDADGEVGCRRAAFVSVRGTLIRCACLLSLYISIAESVGVDVQLANSM